MDRTIPKAVTIPVTTRAIGFGTTHTFALIYGHFASKNIPDSGNIYQLYRVGLAVMEAKIEAVEVGGHRSLANFQDYTTPHWSVDKKILHKCRHLPDQLSTVINSVGELKISQRHYVPKIAKDNYTPAKMFIPQSEQVTYSNLRRVVEALADEKTPEEYRRKFYDNNPIPGAIWNGEVNNPILLNPDEIMPAKYDNINLHNDLSNISAKLDFLNMRAQRYYFTQPVNFDIKGSKAILACNEQGTLRVSDRNVDEELTAYYRRIDVEGEVERYYNLERLSQDEQLEANWCLLGERPVINELIYPVYLLRDKRACIEFGSVLYVNARHRFRY